MIRTFDNFLTTIAHGNDDIFFTLLTDKFFKIRYIYELLRDYAEYLSGADYRESKEDELCLTFHVKSQIPLAEQQEVVNRIRDNGFTLEITNGKKEIEIFISGKEPTYEHQVDF